MDDNIARHDFDLFNLQAKRLDMVPIFVQRCIAEAFLVSGIDDLRLAYPYNTYHDPTGTDNSAKQMDRLRFAYDLVWSLEIVTRIEDDVLLALFAEEISRALGPFLRMQFVPSFVISGLLSCVICMVDRFAKLSNDFRIDVIGVISELIFAVGKLVHGKKDTHLYNLVCDNIAEKVLSLYPESETKILSSAAMGHQEASAFLVEERHRIVTRLTAAQVERFVDKANASISLRTHRDAPVYIQKLQFLRDYLRNNIVRVIEGQPLPKELTAISSLQDVTYYIIRCGAESTFNELSRFRKNERYLELISHVVKFSFHNHSLDSTIKMIMDTFSWHHRRNRFILHPENVDEDEKKSWRRKGYYTPKPIVTNPPALSDREAHRKKVLKKPVPPAEELKIEKQSSADTYVVPQLGGLTLEDARKILQVALPDFWKRARYRKRLRSIVAYESVWYAQILCTFGECLMEKAQRVTEGADLFRTPSLSNINVESSFAKPAQFESAFDASWFQPGIVGGSFPISIRSAATDDFARGSAEVDTLHIPDILQSFTQASVIAARNGHWIQVLNATRSIWNAHHMIARYQIASTKSYQEYLWKSMYIASEVLLDMLESATVVRVSTDSNGGILETVVKKIDGMPTFRAISASSPWTIQSTRFMLRWTDERDIKQETALNLGWIHRFILFAVYMLQRSMHFQRLIVLSERFNDVAHYSYGEYTLAQILAAQKELGLPEVAIAKTKDLLILVEKARVNARNELLVGRQRISGLLCHQATQLSDNGLEDVLPLDETKIFTVLSAYKQTIEEGKRCEETSLVAKALVELGDFYFGVNHATTAIPFWKKARDLFRQMVKTHTLPLTDKLVFALVCGKLGTFGSHLDVDGSIQNCAEMSEILLECLNDSLPGTQVFFDDSPKRMESLFYGVDLFADKFSLNASLLLKTLIQSSKKLLDADHAHLVVILLEVAVSCESQYFDYHGYRTISLEIISHFRMVRLERSVCSGLGLLFVWIYWNTLVSASILLLWAHGCPNMSGRDFWVPIRSSFRWNCIWIPRVRSILRIRGH